MIKNVKSNYIEDTQDYVCSISPTEFEEYCMEMLRTYVSA